jgi:repressor LexA
MTGIGICDGDLLAVHSTPVAENGAVVVARIDDEVTVKRLRRGREKHRLSLLAENPDYAPIEVDLREQSFAIEGLSVGVIRRGL